MNLGGRQQFAEVHYYFQMIVREDNQEQIQTLALVSKYSDPDAEIFRESHETLWVFRKQQASEELLTVIEVKKIDSVVAVLPLPGCDGMWFLAEKPGLNVAEIGGQVEDLTEE